MIKVNLVPAEILAKARQRQQVFQVVIAGLGVLVIVAGISLAHWVKVKRLESKLDQGQSKLKKLELIVAKVEQIEKTANDVRVRLGVIMDLLKSRSLYPSFMSDFVRSVPLGVLVKNLSTTGGGSAGGPIKLTMSAEARSNEDIAAWVRKMEDLGKFSNTELGPVSVQEAGERMYSFTLTSTYTPTL